MKKQFQRFKKIIDGLLFEEDARDLLRVIIASFAMFILNAALLIEAIITGESIWLYVEIALAALFLALTIVGCVFLPRKNFRLNVSLRWILILLILAFGFLLFFAAPNNAYTLFAICVPLFFVVSFGFWEGWVIFLGLLAETILFLFTPVSSIATHAITDTFEKIALVIAFLVCSIVGFGSSLANKTVVNHLSDSRSDFEDLAYRDSLTGIHNHVYLNKYLEAFREHPTPGLKFGLMFIDLDNLKTVNDRYGHLVGNEVLKAVAEALSHAKSDLLVRWGGDEFILIENNCEKHKLFEDANAIKRAVSELRFEKHPDLTTSISIGISYHTIENEADFDSIIREADEQLSKSKSAGKNTVSIKG